MKKILKNWFLVLKERFWNTKTARNVLDILFCLGCIFFYIAPMTVICRIICFVASFIIFKALHSIIRVTDDMNIPKWGERFTKKMPDGSIAVVKGRIHEAILYLYSLEEYMERL